MPSGAAVGGRPLPGTTAPPAQAIAGSARPGQPAARERSPGLAEIQPLTGIRAAAALWVVLFHLREPMADLLPGIWGLLEPVVSGGFLGVDLFFILSGFIIHYNYAARLSAWRPAAIGDFWGNRFARIWPVHAAMLLLVAGLLALQRLRGGSPTHPELYGAADFVRNLFMVHAWTMPIRVSWNTPAWSISCEWLAYLAYPLLAVTLLRGGGRRRAILVAGLAMGGTALVCQGFDAPASANFGVVRIAGEFLGGCALCQLFQTRWLAGWNWKWILPLLGVVGVVLFRWILPAAGGNSYWCVPVLGAIIYGLACGGSPIAAFFSRRTLLFGGHISYSLYMVHQVCLIALQGWPTRFGLLGLAAELLVMLVAAALLHLFLEEPCRKGLRKLLIPRKVSRVGAA